MRSGVLSFMIPLYDCETDEWLRSQSKNAETMRGSAEEKQALGKDE